MLGYENGKNEFVIPVNWAVADTVTVQADTLEEAYDWAVEHAEEIPCGDEPEYIDGSYEIGDYELTKCINQLNKRGCVS